MQKKFVYQIYVLDDSGELSPYQPCLYSSRRSAFKTLLELERPNFRLIVLRFPLFS